MKALVWHGPRRMSVERVPRPVPGPGEVLVRVAAVGICGSELSGYLGQNSLRVPPLIMGHEFSGTIEEAGEGVEGFRAGDRVVINPMVSCKHCGMCRRGLENLCVNRCLIGAHRPGAFGEWVAVPERACYRLPDDLNDIKGALAEPLACSLRAVRLAGVGVQSTVLIFGAGAIGLFALVASRRAGAGLTAVVDTNPNRLHVAREWGADLTLNPREVDPVDTVKAATDGLGVDSVIDAVGLPVTRQQGVRAARPAGTVIFIGLHEDGTELAGNSIVRSETRIIGSFCYSWDDFQASIGMLRAGALTPDPSWLEERPLELGQQSFDELIDRPTPLSKIVLRP